MLLEVLLFSQILSWLLVLGLAFAVYALARQVGVLHERIAPMGALMHGQGPSPGQPAPLIQGIDPNGQPRNLGGPRVDGGDQDRLVIFVAPDCPVCKKILPIARDLTRDETGVELWLAGEIDADGTRNGQALAAHRDMLTGLGLSGVPMILAPNVGLSFRIGKLPHAVLIDKHGILRSQGLVNTREHLESLFVARDSGHASIQEYLSGAGASHNQASN
jgi:methylamine dehydrogenase accessory protein MauD